MKISIKLPGVIIAGAAVATVMICALAYRSTKSALQDAIGQNQLALAQRTMEQIESLLHERYINMQANAGESSFTDILLNPKKGVQRQDLARIKDLTVVTGPWNKLFVVDRQGTILLSSDEEMIGQPIAREPHRGDGFREAIQGRAYHSDFLRFEDTGKFAVFYSAPIRDPSDPKRPIIGAIMGGFSWQAIEEILENIPASALLVDREGTVIADSAGEESGRFLRNLKDGPLLGVPSLTSSVPQKGRLSYLPNGWSLVLETPADVALAPAVTTALRLVSLLIPLILLIVGLVIFLISKLVIRPISVLTNAARAIQAGDLSQQIPIPSRDEVGQLAVSFNAMVNKVREAQEGLEKKVSERTHELRKAQQQLLQAQKMESIGRLTGGVAHDFNNLLGIVTGYCELSLKGLAADSPLRQNLREIKEAGERATSLTRQLLAFSRKQILQPRVLNLNDVLRRMDRMIGRLIGEDIRLLTYLEPEAGQVKADPTQMEQVILNLALNARDAMSQGGRLTLETKNVSLDRDYADRYPEVRPGPYVMMAVSDTGKGMSAEEREHAFEPFFTTKERGRGTGLGLSTVYGIVKQSGGHISVYSESGRGTSFKIYLPRVNEKAEPLPSQESSPVSVRGIETVLVVEDEARLLKLFSQILREKGYTVLEAFSGEEALKVGGSHPGPIELLVTDVVMPGISGPNTAGQLASKRPGLKVLYLSGYTDNAIVHHGVLDEGTNFLQKPFTPEAFAEKVRKVLDGIQ